MGALTFLQVLEQARRAECRIEELEASLKSMRKAHKAWEQGIEFDERYPVQLLYKTLQEAREEHARYLATEITGTVHP